MCGKKRLGETKDIHGGEKGKIKKDAHRRCVGKILSRIRTGIKA